MKRLLPLVVLSAALCCQSALAEGKMWVAESGASIKDAPNSSANTVKDLPPGLEVNTAEAEGRWFKVTEPGGASGWIYRGKLLDAKPAEQSASTDPFGGAFSSKIASDSTDTSRSVRGLSPETEQYANSAGTPAEHRKALDHMVALAPKPEEVNRFLKEGKIGEYADK